LNSADPVVCSISEAVGITGSFGGGCPPGACAPAVSGIALTAAAAAIILQKSLRFIRTPELFELYSWCRNYVSQPIRLTNGKLQKPKKFIVYLARTP
jgi:hypothetical protein